LAAYNPDEPSLPTNSPRAHYALTDDALAAIRTYGTSGWKRACETFLAAQGSLREKYGKKITRRLVPVRLPDGNTFELSPGEHNVVQAAVVEQFIPRFAPGSRLLYLRDTAKKNLYVDEKAFQKLGITLTDHD